jgi:hypothetical protein
MKTLTVTDAQRTVAVAMPGNVERFRHRTVQGLLLQLHGNYS